MWETTNRTTVGLLLAAVGDVDEAALVAGEVSRCFARMGFRNRWSDALSVRVATDLPPAEGGLLAGWSRYRLRRSTSERDGYRELVLTFEHLLRCCVTWNGVAADPSSCRLAGRRLWDAAKSNVRKQFTINLTAALTDSEVGALFDARNVQAHRVNPRGDWAEHSRVLAAALIRFEHLLPTALLDETTGAIRPPLIRR
jgi:hypothetical protein